MIELQPDLDLTVSAERLLEAWLGVPVSCSRLRRLQGGLVSTVLQLDFDRPPHRAVVKLHESGGDSFAQEARALEYLRVETTCPVPRVYLQDGSTSLVPFAFLLLEHLPGACLKDVDLEPPERSDLEAQLADVLIELHRHKGPSWGAIDGADGPASWPDLFASRLLEARAHPDVIRRLDPEVLAQVDEAIRLA